MTGLAHHLGELLFPRACAGCAAPGYLLCPTCKKRLATPPFQHTPNLTVHVPVFALGTYDAPHRGVGLAMKEKKNLAVRRHIGAVLAAALDHLEARGDIIPGAHLIPAPTRPSAARARGGDPVSAVCHASGRPTHDVFSLLDATPDQASLDESARRRNLSGNVQLSAVPQGPLIVVDDVVTTGATLQAVVEKLLVHGGNPVACVVLAAA